MKLCIIVHPRRRYRASKYVKVSFSVLWGDGAGERVGSYFILKGERVRSYLTISTGGGGGLTSLRGPLCSF